MRISHIKNLILDMDGVLWRGDTPMPGLVEFFATLRQLNIGFVLATNNATKTAAQYAEKLAGMGVGVPAAQILTSSEATAAYLKQHHPAGTAVFVIGEAGLQMALQAQGFTVVDDLPYFKPAKTAAANGTKPAIVVVGLNKEVCYEQLATAALLVAGGAMFIGTNPDPSLPSEYGQIPGAGALLAAITATTGIQPTVIGKPGRILFQEALRRLGSSAVDTAMVGDRLTTDIAGGRAAGLLTILVLTGIASRADVESSDVKPDFIFEDLPALARELRNGARRG